MVTISGGGATSNNKLLRDMAVRPTDDWGFSTVEYGINNQVSLGEAELDGVSYKLI